METPRMIDSIFFATFSLYKNGRRMAVNGMITQMLWYFLPRAKRFLLLDQPCPESNPLHPVVELYKDGKLSRKGVISPLFYLPLYVLCKLQNTDKTHVSFKLRDLFSVFHAGFWTREPYDLFIGMEAINTIAGLLLKKLGKVKRVVYYVSEYSPRRYGQTFFNAVYIWMDQLCVRYADATWDTTPSILEGRKEAGLPQELAHKVVDVPNGVFPWQIRIQPIAKRMPDSIVFMGILTSDMGADLAIRALSLLRKKRPKSVLHIIGGQREDIVPLRKLAIKLGIGQSVIFHGFLDPKKEMTDIMSHCMVGIAPYRNIAYSRRRYGDPGKIRQYHACGLAVVTTPVTWYGRYIAKVGGGVLAKDTPGDLTKKIADLLSNRKKYQTMARTAANIGRANTWEKTYQNAVRALNAHLS